MATESHEPVSEHDPKADAPATWENVAVGKVKEAVGELLGDRALVAEGEEQEEIAHEVRDAYKREKDGEAAAE